MANNRKMFILRVDQLFALTSISAVLDSGGPEPLISATVAVPNVANVTAVISAARVSPRSWKVGLANDAVSLVTALVFDSSLATDVIKLIIVQNGVSTDVLPSISEELIDPKLVASAALAASLAAISSAA